MTGTKIHNVTLFIFLFKKHFLHAIFAKSDTDKFNRKKPPVCTLAMKAVHLNILEFSVRRQRKHGIHIHFNTGNEV